MSSFDKIIIFKVCKEQNSSFLLKNVSEFFFPMWKHFGMASNTAISRGILQTKNWKSGISISLQECFI